MRLHKLANGCGKSMGKWLRPEPEDQRLLAELPSLRWARLMEGGGLEHDFHLVRFGEEGDSTKG